MDYSPPGSSVHGILQARILEGVAISFFRDLPDPGIKLRSPALQADSLPSELQGSPPMRYYSAFFFFFVKGKSIHCLVRKRDFKHTGHPRVAVSDQSDVPPLGFRSVLRCILVVDF